MQSARLCMHTCSVDHLHLLSWTYIFTWLTMHICLVDRTHLFGWSHIYPSTYTAALLTTLWWWLLPLVGVTRFTECTELVRSSFWAPAGAHSLPQWLRIWEHDDKSRRLLVAEKDMYYWALDDTRTKFQVRSILKFSRPDDLPLMKQLSATGWFTGHCLPHWHLRDWLGGWERTVD